MCLGAMLIWVSYRFFFFGYYHGFCCFKIRIQTYFYFRWPSFLFLFLLLIYDWLSWSLVVRDEQRSWWLELGVRGGRRQSWSLEVNFAEVGRFKVNVGVGYRRWLSLELIISNGLRRSYHWRWLLETGVDHRSWSLVYVVRVWQR